MQKKIKDKFGSVLRFATLAGIEYNTLYRDLELGKVEKYEKAYKLTDPEIITDAERERLRDKILDAKQFARDNRLTPYCVMTILAGTQKFKTTTYYKIINRL